MRIQLLCDGGGIGDLLRRIGIARSIKLALPDAEIWLFALDHQIKWAQLDPIVDQLVSVTYDGRRPFNAIPNPLLYPYLETGAPFYATIDLYDPAEAYEDRESRIITRSRPDTWLSVAEAVLGCKLTHQHCVLAQRKDATVQAAVKLHEKLGGPPGFLVGLQPLSHWRWRSMGDAQTHAVIRALKEKGAQCVLFHHEDEPVKRWAEELGVAAVIGEKPEVLVEMVRVCDAFISGDSGFFHIANLVNVPTVGLFAQTNGEAIGRNYSTCRTINAGPAEREGLSCTSPCYRRATYGCDRMICELGCRAIQRIAPARVVDAVMELIREHKGKHLPAEERDKRAAFHIYD